MAPLARASWQASKSINCIRTPCPPYDTHKLCQALHELAETTGPQAFNLGVYACLPQHNAVRAGGLLSCEALIGTVLEHAPSGRVCFSDIKGMLAQLCGQFKLSGVKSPNNWAADVAERIMTLLSHVRRLKNPTRWRQAVQALTSDQQDQPQMLVDMMQDEGEIQATQQSTLPQPGPVASLGQDEGEFQATQQSLLPQPAPVASPSRALSPVSLSSPQGINLTATLAMHGQQASAEPLPTRKQDTKRLALALRRPHHRLQDRPRQRSQPIIRQTVAEAPSPLAEMATPQTQKRPSARTQQRSISPPSPHAEMATPQPKKQKISAPSPHAEMATPQKKASKGTFAGRRPPSGAASLAFFRFVVQAYANREPSDSRNQQQFWKDMMAARVK